MYRINTFASERLLLKKNNEQFIFRNTSNLTHHYNTKPNVSNFMHFKDEIAQKKV